MPKPELGKVAVGDKLIVLVPKHRGEAGPYQVEVIKAAPVWLTLQQVDNASRTWRMRRDTQDEGGDTNYNPRFVTAEQYAWEQHQTEVHNALQNAGIRMREDSPWKGEERRTALAEFISQYEAKHPPEEGQQSPADIDLKVPQMTADGGIRQYTGGNTPDGDPLMINPSWTPGSVVPLSRLIAEWGPLTARPDLEIELCDAHYGVGDGTAAHCVRAEGHPPVSQDEVGHSNQEQHRGR